MSAKLAADGTSEQISYQCSLMGDSRETLVQGLRWCPLAKRVDQYLALDQLDRFGRGVADGRAGILTGFFQSGNGGGGGFAELAKRHGGLDADKLALVAKGLGQHRHGHLR